MKSLFITLFLILLILFNVIFVFSLSPGGANVSVLNTTTAPIDAPQSASAQAGNVTEMNIFGYSTTQSWQGYYGNVTGSITLEDGSGKTLYNWSATSPSGEVYASRNSTIDWSSVMCFNFTARGNYLDDSSQVGNTSYYGTNITQLESAYNISVDSVDGVNETFFNNNGHDNFYTANKRFNISECPSAKIFDNSGASVNDHFEEVLLYEWKGRSIIFTSLLEKDVLGYDSRSHDFEMLVLEDGHGTDISPTNYYFYVELE